MAEQAMWYVVHTYSGYENKVAKDLETLMENNHLEDQICEVKVPVEMVPEIKNGKEKLVEHKLFPGYVLVKMIMTDETWYWVRNTRGVTGFVGASSKPLPLSEEEAAKLGMDKTTRSVDYQVGDTVEIADGPLKDYIGTVESIDLDAGKVQVTVSMFGRETPAELELNQVKPL